MSASVEGQDGPGSGGDRGPPPEGGGPDGPPQGPPPSIIIAICPIFSSYKYPLFYFRYYLFFKKINISQQNKINVYIHKLNSIACILL